jgi:hypothetical protein
VRAAVGGGSNRWARKGTAWTAQKGRGAVGAGPWRRTLWGSTTWTPQRSRRSTQLTACTASTTLSLLSAAASTALSTFCGGEGEEVEKLVRTPGGAGRRWREGASRGAASPGCPGGPVHAPPGRAARTNSDHAAIARFCKQDCCWGRGRPTAGCSNHHSGSNFAASAHFTQAPSSNGRRIKINFKRSLTVLLPTQPILLLCVWRKIRSS